MDDEIGRKCSSLLRFLHWASGLFGFNVLCSQGQAPSSACWGMCYPTVFISGPSSAGEQLQTFLSPPGSNQVDRQASQPSLTLLTQPFWDIPIVRGKHIHVTGIKWSTGTVCPASLGLFVWLIFSTLPEQVFEPLVCSCKLYWKKCSVPGELSTRSHLSVYGKAGYRCQYSLCWCASRLMQGE